MALMITGYRLQHLIREATHRRDLIASRWDEAQYRFEGETGPTPTQISDEYWALEEKIATLQVIQDAYNLRVRVVVQKREMPLASAVKLIGGAGRLEKMWRGAAGGKKRDRFSYGEDRVPSRETNKEFAIRAISSDDALKEASAKGRLASELRQAVQTANATQWAVEDLPGVGNVEPSVFD